LTILDQDWYDASRARTKNRTAAPARPQRTPEEQAEFERRMGFAQHVDDPPELVDERRVLHLWQCDACGYAANAEVATFSAPSPAAEPALPLEEVATPDTRTITALTALLGIPASRTAKAAFFMAGDRLIFAVVRGDMDVNEGKLAVAVGASDLRSATAEELTTAGIVAGYASPIGVRGVTVVADDLVTRDPERWKKVVDPKMRAGLMAGLAIPAVDYVRALRIRGLAQETVPALFGRFGAPPSGESPSSTTSAGWSTAAGTPGPSCTRRW